MPHAALQIAWSVVLVVTASAMTPSQVVKPSALLARRTAQNAEQRVLAREEEEDHFSPRNALLDLHASEALTTLEVGLIVVALVSTVCVCLLAWKIIENTKKTGKMHGRVQGLQSSAVLDQMKRGHDKQEAEALCRVLAKEQRFLAQEEALLSEEDAEIARQKRELEASEAVISSQRAIIKAIDAETKSLIEAVLRRNKVHVDLGKQAFRIVEPIIFKPVFATKEMQEAPAAEFEDVSKAMEVLGDFAMLLEYLPQSVVLVEGHTSGGSAALTNLGFQIAAERAEKVVAALISLGVPDYRLDAKGRPGIMGDNQFDTKIVTLSWGH